MHLQIMVGSIREAQVAPPVATWVEQIAVAHGTWAAELVDPKTSLPMSDVAKPPAVGAYQGRIG